MYLTDIDIEINIDSNYNKRMSCIIFFQYYIYQPFRLNPFRLYNCQACIGPRYLSWSKTVYEKNKLLIDRSSIISYPESLYDK